MRINLQLFATKKGGGSTKNGRDSISKRLGVKRHDGQYVSAGVISKARVPDGQGANVELGKDDTLFAKVDGYVTFERCGKDHKQVSVLAEREVVTA